jgi:hypothetical protein
MHRPMPSTQAYAWPQLVVTAAALTLDTDIKVNPNRAPVDTLFTYPSVYTLGPSYQESCQNTDELFSKRTFPCEKGKFPTGVFPCHLLKILNHHALACLPAFVVL